MDEKRGIGKDNKLLWRIPEDLKRFKQITSGHPIIMGRKTYESIGRPLPNRTNIVVTRDKQYAISGTIVVYSLKEAIQAAQDVIASTFDKLGVNSAKQSQSEKSDVSKVIHLGGVLDMTPREIRGEREIFIIGGGQIFEQALPMVDRLYLTIVKGDFGADTFFPDYSEFKKIVSKQVNSSGGYEYTFLVLEK